MNSDMSQQVYQVLGDRYQPAIEYAMLRNYAQQLGNIQQNPYFYEMIEAYNNRPNFAMLQGGNNTPQQQQYLDNIRNILLTGDIHPTSSSLGASL